MPVKMEHKKPHAIVMPLPSQGHITPLLKLAKLLHHNGFHVTFVNTEIIHQRILRSQGSASALDGIPTFRFAQIPDGLYYETVDSGQDVTAVVDAFRNKLPVYFKKLVLEINGEACGSGELPPISCIVSDGFVSFTVDVAEELGVPNVLVWPLSASSAMAYAQFGQLMEKKLLPLPDDKSLRNGYLETAIDWIQGMEGIRLKDFPTMVRITDPNDISFHFTKENVERSKKASANVLNTFDALEAKFIKNELLHQLYPNVYSIGPFHLLENHLPENNEVKYFGSNMYKEDSGCLSWLDLKEPESVILVSFGTTGFLTEEQLVEFAWGLADSPHNFIWIVSTTLVGGESSLLPPDFETKIKNRGLLASWCDQEAVLKHPAVGGFLTHCGWNSVLESICAGVPMIFCPTFADQVTNSWYCMNNLEVGLLLDGEITRNKIEGLVGKLMGGEKRKKMKQNVLNLKTLAEEACLDIAGSSYKNFEKVVHVLLSKPSDHN